MYISALCWEVIDRICAAPDLSGIIDVTPVLVGGTNATTDTVVYCVGDTVNVKCPCLSSPKLEWIEAALEFSIILVTVICSYDEGSVIVGRIGYGDLPVMLSISVGMILLFVV